MRRALFQDLMVVALAIACTASGYYCGKHAADRYYANALCFHGSTNGAPVAATPQMNDMCADGDSLWGPPVKLIPPIKVRTAAPIASVEEPR